jgi:hypothetical protein
MSREAEEKLGTCKHMARTKCRFTSPQSICKGLGRGVLREELAGRIRCGSVNCRITWRSCRAQRAKDAKFNGKREA